MIAKDLDPFVADDKFARAGRAAEEQMAFYLRRALASEENVQVLNGIRLERDGDVAQIDHLVFHPFGGVIIESKSVTGTVRINTHGEWMRVYGAQTRGMPSPILQAQRQAAFLADYLAGRPDAADLPLVVRVAISDQGVIQRPRNLQLDEVCKADQVPDEIRQIFRAHALFHNPMPMVQAVKSIMGSMGIRVATKPIDRDTLSQIAAFLLAEHRPLVRPSRPATPVAPPAAAPRVVTPQPPANCRHCGSTDLAVAYKYSYYFKCRSCAKNTAIHLICATCGSEERVRKAGDCFFRDCPTCNTSRSL